MNIAFVMDDRSADDCIGEWVLVHVGFAMSRIDAAEAARTLALLEELGEIQAELEAMQIGVRHFSSPCGRGLGEGARPNPRPPPPNPLPQGRRSHCIMKYVDEFRDPA